MTPPANLASLIVLAGFGIAAGIAVLYHYLNTNSEEQPHAYHRSPRRRSPSPSPSPVPERRRLRAISPPPRESQNHRRTPTPPREARNTTDRAASVSNRRNIARRRPEETLSCVICTGQLNTGFPRIELECHHVFHDQCYTVWRHAVVTINPHANLCPSC